MSLRIVAGVLVLGGAALVIGCSGGRSHLPVAKTRKIDAEAAGRRAIEQYDKNADGKLSGAELDNCPALKEFAKAVRKSMLSAEDISEQIKSWDEGSAGVLITVLRNGVPLKDAEVKLVPEKFLGGDLPTGQGATSELGLVAMDVPLSSTEPSPRDVFPGFYRVEITKAGQTVPAKYNSQTTLGIVLSPELVGDRGRMNQTFNLNY